MAGESVPWLLHQVGRISVLWNRIPRIGYDAFVGSLGLSASGRVARERYRERLRPTLVPRGACPQTTDEKNGGAERIVGGTVVERFFLR